MGLRPGQGTVHGWAWLWWLSGLRDFLLRASQSCWYAKLGEIKEFCMVWASKMGWVAHCGWECRLAQPSENSAEGPEQVTRPSIPTPRLALNWQTSGCCCGEFTVSKTQPSQASISKWMDQEKVVPVSSRILARLRRQCSHLQHQCRTDIKRSEANHLTIESERVKLLQTAGLVTLRGQNMRMCQEFWPKDRRFQLNKFKGCLVGHGN